MSRKRKDQFDRFVAAHRHAFADVAVHGRGQQGRGAVILRVIDLKGGDRFTIKQRNLNLQYHSLQSIFDEGTESGKPKWRLEKLLNQYNPENQMVVAALYDDGGWDALYMGIGQRKPVNHPVIDQADGQPEHAMVERSRSCP